MGECITGVAEKMEIVGGAAINMRNAAIKRFVGLGPPDLVVLNKSYNPPKLIPSAISKPQTSSYYHWALGVDTSSESVIAAYFGNLIEKQEKSGFGRGTFKITTCSFCSYNCFRKMDLHVDMDLSNGKLTVYALDVDGHSYELDTPFWKELYVSSVLRSLNGAPANLRPLKIMDMLNDPITEDRFFSICHDIFITGPKLGMLDSSGLWVQNAMQGLPPVDGSNNLLTTTISYYLMKYNRFDSMISFFQDFQETDSSASVPVADATLMLGLPSQAISLLEAAHREHPESDTILVALARALLHQVEVPMRAPQLALRRSVSLSSHSLASALSGKDVSLSSPQDKELEESLLRAVKCCTTAATRSPQWARAWWTLARVLIALKRYEWALLIMNHAPWLEANGSHEERTALNPPFQKITTPVPRPPHVSIIVQDEDADFERDEGDSSLRLLSASTLPRDTRIAYDLLISMVDIVGWQQVAFMRSQVLEKPAEPVRASLRRSRDMAEEQQQQLQEQLQSPSSSKDSSGLWHDDDDLSEETNREARSMAVENVPQTEQEITAVSAQLEKKGEDPFNKVHEVDSQDESVEGSSDTSEEDIDDEEEAAQIFNEESNAGDSELDIVSQDTATTEKERVEIAFDANEDGKESRRGSVAVGNDREKSLSQIALHRALHKTSNLHKGRIAHLTPSTPPSTPASETGAFTNGDVTTVKMAPLYLASVQEEENHSSSASTPEVSSPAIYPDISTCSEAEESSVRDEFEEIALKENELHGEKDEETGGDYLNKMLSNFLLKSRASTKYSTATITLYAPLPTYATSGDDTLVAGALNETAVPVEVEVPAAEIGKNVELAFHAVFQDIKAYHAWKEEEKKKQVMFVRDDDVLVAKTINPDRLPADWLRLANLAYRLNHKNDAEKLFTLVTNMPPSVGQMDRWTVRGWLGLMKLSGERGDIRASLVAMSNILRYYSDKYVEVTIHPEAVRVMLYLISQYGLQKVRNIVATIPNAHPAISTTLLLDAVRWRSKGYDC